MTIIHVPVVELLYQAPTRWIPVLKYLMSGAGGRLLPCPVIPCIKYRRFPRSWLWWCLPGTENPQAWLPGAQVCLEPGGVRQTGLIDGKILPAHCIRDGGKC
jgi:hypothetical protein